MNKKDLLLASLRAKVDALTVTEDITHTPMDNVILFKRSSPHPKEIELYPEGVGFILQGKKRFIVEGKVYEQSQDHYLTLLSPMPVECELIEVSEEKPLLGIAIFIDRIKLANLQMKMEKASAIHTQPVTSPQSAITSTPMEIPLLESLLRLMDALSAPMDIAILSQAMEEEIYYRLLQQASRNGLHSLITSNGKVHQVAKAIEHINQNLDKTCSVEELSTLVNMSQSGFQKKFKEVMHTSPVQYAKQVKLNRAKHFLSEGLSVSQAFLKVGYNNAGQFSREYKRYFGVPPSMDFKTGKI